MKTAIARYQIGTITTKDLELYKRSKELQQSGRTIEYIFRRGIEELEKEKNNNAEYKVLRINNEVV